MEIWNGDACIWNSWSWRRMPSSIFTNTKTAVDIRRQNGQDINNNDINFFDREQPSISIRGAKLPWASCQIRKTAGCECTGNAGNVFPVTVGWWPRHASRHVRHARAVMHAGIANQHFPLKSVAGKTFPTFPAHAQPELYVSGKRPMQWSGIATAQQAPHHCLVS